MTTTISETTVAEADALAETTAIAQADALGETTAVAEADAVAEATAIAEAAAIAKRPLVASIDDDGTERITIFDDHAAAICEASRPLGHLYWRLYLSGDAASAHDTDLRVSERRLLRAAAAGMLRPTSREEARYWLEFIGTLCTGGSAV